MIKPVLSLAALALLAACNSGPRQSIPDRIIDRALAGAPGQAQPGVIVAREIEFARAAREEGQWSAFRAFAAPDALLHGPAGTVQARQWLAGRSDPPASVQWEPRAVWMSCDGSLAVSQGRFRDPQGMVGNYYTVWERQPDGAYLWTYDMGAPDDPQPAPRQRFEDGDIVVTSLDAVRAQIADCPRRADSVPTPPAFSLAGDFTHGGKVSPDGTLRWRWEHRATGERRLVVDYLHRGEWVSALDETIAAGIAAEDPVEDEAG